MTDGMILGLFGLVVTLIAIVTPIVKLNSNIVKLTVSIDNLEKRFEESQNEIKTRVTAHGYQIDELEKTAVRHDERITSLEKGGGK